MKIKDFRSISLVLLSLSCFQLSGSDIAPAVFSEENHRSPFYPGSDFRFVANVSVKAAEESPKNLNCYFKAHSETHELEFLVIFDGSPINIVSLKGANITDIDLRILFRAARIDPQSETGRGLISDVYSNIFALSGLSFTFGDLKLEEKLRNLTYRIKAGDYKKHDEFRERLARSAGRQ